jgi:ABC-type dipeptide/oligopeptide/nickel transport system permease subunit
MGLSKAQKHLLIWSGGLLVLAEIIKRVPMGQKTTMTVGFIELILAIFAGIAFGFAASKRSG